MPTRHWYILGDWVSPFPVVGSTLKELLEDVAMGLRTPQINRYKLKEKINTRLFSFYFAVGTVDKACKLLLIDGRLCDMDFRYSQNIPHTPRFLEAQYQHISLAPTKL